MNDENISFRIGKNIFVSNNPDIILKHKNKYKDIIVFLSTKNDFSLVGEDVYRLNNCNELIDFIKFYKNNKDLFAIKD